jgi:hypothetical protein
MNLLAKLRLVSIALIAAITLALGSVYVERAGPELAAYGNMCGPHADELCLEPVLKDGFPVAYLFDTPGVSIERQLSIGEDRLFVGPLILDIAIYFAIVLSAILVIGRARMREFRGR